MLNRVFIISVIIWLLPGCNSLTKQGFGAMSIDLPCNQRLLNVTWKGEAADLWIHTRPMQPDEQPIVHTFRAKTAFGVFEGEVTLKEKRCL